MELLKTVEKVEGSHDAIIEPVEWQLVQMEATAGLIQKLADENATRKLDQHDYRKKYDGYADRFVTIHGSGSRS